VRRWEMEESMSKDPTFIARPVCTRLWSQECLVETLNPVECAFRHRKGYCGRIAFVGMARAWAEALYSVNGKNGSFRAISKLPFLELGLR